MHVHEYCRPSTVNSAVVDDTETPYFGNIINKCYAWKEMTR